MHVLFCASTDYYQYLGAAAVSLAEHGSAHRNINIHVLSMDRDPRQESLLRLSLEPFGNVDLRFHFYGGSDLDGFFVDWRIKREAYLRLLAPVLLPPEIRRVLYLDCDVIVLDRLDDLWTADLKDKAAAAVPDILISCFDSVRGPRYVNSGVLLMDLAKWRDRDYTSKLLEYAHDHRDWLEYHDQDTLNSVLGDDILRVGYRWNLQAIIYRFSKKRLGPLFEAVEAARRDPAILHYVSDQKPWQHCAQVPRKRDYFRCQRRTAWRGIVPDLPSARARLWYRLDRGLAVIGFDAQRTIQLMRLAARKVSRFSLQEGRSCPPQK